MDLNIKLSQLVIFILKVLAALYIVAFVITVLLVIIAVLWSLV